MELRENEFVWCLAIAPWRGSPHSIPTQLEFHFDRKMIRGIASFVLRRDRLWSISLSVLETNIQSIRRFWLPGEVMKRSIRAAALG